jgi:hypothetical protein
LLSFISTWRAAILVLVDLGAVAFFASGVAEAHIGPSAPWFVLAAVLVGICLRAVDVEARALFIPGGLFGGVREAFGPGTAAVAVSALAAERLLMGPLAAAVAGRYIARLLSVWSGADAFTAGLISDGATAAAVALLAYVWWMQRLGRWLTTQTITRAVAAVVSVLVVAVGWGAVTGLVRGASLPPLPPLPRTPGAASRHRCSWCCTHGRRALRRVALNGAPHPKPGPDGMARLRVCLLITALARL